MSAHHDQDRACLDGFEVEIFKLVKKRATPEQWKEWLRAPLEHAAAEGNMHLFTSLMDAGADGSAGWRGCGGRTLLASAAYGRSEKMVLALLAAGAKPDLDVKFGAETNSALHVAAALGAEAVSLALLLAGADPNLQGEDDDLSPLHVAAERGHHGIVTDLLLSNACPDAKTRDMQYTPLHLAAREGHAPCVSTLLQRSADKDSRNAKNETPLLMAVNKNQLRAVEELLAAGASLNIRDAEDYSVLDRAALEGYEDVVKVLLRHGDDINARDGYGFAALDVVAGIKDGRDSGDIIRVLLAAGADIESRTAELCDFPTPLYRAAHMRSTSRGIMHALLEGGADIHALDASNMTPLHVACTNSNVVGVELLLRWGADENQTDEDGRTAASCVGTMELDEEVDEDRKEQRKIDDKRIRHMLARAPADRSWRRRGWLVLYRSYPTKVPVTKDSSGGGSSAKVSHSRRGGDEASDERVNVGNLARSVLGLEAEDVFRLVVGFL